MNWTGLNTLKFQKIISLYRCLIQQNLWVLVIFSFWLSKMLDIRLVIRQAVARPWGRWLAGGSSTTSVACLGLPDYLPYVAHVLCQRKNGLGLSILFYGGTWVQGNYNFFGGGDWRGYPPLIGNICTPTLRKGNATHLWDFLTLSTFGSYSSLFCMTVKTVFFMEALLLC